MFEIDDRVPIPLTPHELRLREIAKRLNLAGAIYEQLGVSKSVAARRAIEQLGVWPMVEPQSAIDFIRQRLGKNGIQGSAR